MTVFSTSLDELLQQCTVEIHIAHSGPPGPNSFVGSGFFILPNVVLTCAHVVEDAESNAVVVWRKHSITTTGTRRYPPERSRTDKYYPFPDLGVIHLKDPPEHPCVLLTDRDPESDRAIIARGFSTSTPESGVHRDGLLMKVAGPAGNFLRVTKDRVIPGLSGSPVVDSETGKVCGLVKATRNPTHDQGGWITPAESFKVYIENEFVENGEWNSEHRDWVHVLTSSSAAFDSLLSGQIRAGDDLPYHTYGKRNPKLSEVYIPQKLRKAVQDDSRGLEKEGEEEFIDPISSRDESLADAIFHHEHLLVIGGAGQGKSVMTKRLAADLAYEWGVDSTKIRDNHPKNKFKRTEPVLPLRVTARRLAANGKLPWREALAVTANSELGLRQDSSAATQLPTTPADVRWLVLIDGIDEIVDHWRRRDLINTLAARISETSSAFRIVITTRALAKPDLMRLEDAGAIPYYIKPFDGDELEEFADKWFRGSRTDGQQLAREYLNQLQRSGLIEMASAPLLATLSAVIFEKNPDQPLPTHRYDLYSTYVKEILYGRHESAQEELAHLTKLIASVPDGETLVQSLYLRRAELASHLAVTALESERSLLNEALKWTERHISGVEIPLSSPEWEEVVATAAASTGLLIRHAGDLAFLQNFAEYLAAKHYASLLPSTFDWTVFDWYRWVEKAAGDTENDVAQAVLTHHTRTHSDGLISKLLGGSYRYRVLAGELMAQGALATPEFMDLFLAALKQGAVWRAVPQNKSQDLYARAVNAASGLIEYPETLDALEEITRDLTAPIHNRVRSAHVLALAGDQGRDRAVRALRSGLITSETSPYDRAWAANVLAVVDPTCRDEAAEFLHKILIPPRFGVRLYAARVLENLGPEYREQAAEALRANLRHPRASTLVRSWGARALVNFGAKYQLEGARALLSVLSDPHARAQAYRVAATTLADLDPQFHDEAIRILLIGLNNPQPYARSWAAKSLVEISPDYSEKAEEVLQAAFFEIRHDAAGRVWIIQVLETLGASYRGKVIELIQTLLTELPKHSAFRPRLAKNLVELDSKCFDQAERVLRAIIKSGAKPSTRLLAAGVLADLGRNSSNEISSSLRDVLPSLPRNASVPANMKFIEVFSDYQKTVAQTLRDFLAKWVGEAERRKVCDPRNALLATILAGLDFQYHDEAGQALKSILASVPMRKKSALGQVQVAKALADISPLYFCDATEVLQDMATHPNLKMGIHSAAAKALTEIDPRFNEEAAHILLGTLKGGKKATIHTFCNTARLLSGLGPQYRIEAIKALEDLTSDPAIDPPARNLVLKQISDL